MRTFRGGDQDPTDRPTDRPLSLTLLSPSLALPVATDVDLLDTTCETVGIFAGFPWEPFRRRRMEDIVKLG